MLHKSILIFFAIIVLLVLPALYPTPFIIGISLTAGSLLVVWQAFIILTDKKEEPL